MARTRPTRTSGAPPALGRLTLRGIRSTSRGLPAAPMRVFGSYAIVYLLDGHGHYADATGRDLRVAAGDLILIFPDIAHTYGPDAGQTWIESFLVFDGPVFDLWRRRRLLDDRDPVWRLDPVAYWARRMESIAGDADKPGAAAHTLDIDEAASLQRVCQLQKLLADALAHRRAERIGQTQVAWIEQARALLDRSAATGAVDWEVLCEPLAMSYQTFRKRFTRLTGTPPARYRMARVIDRACQLLKQHPDRKLRAIALDLGFCDEFHFSRRFKQLVGVWPTDFRRRLGT